MLVCVRGSCRHIRLLVLKRPVLDKYAQDRVALDAVHEVAGNDIVLCLNRGGGHARVALALFLRPPFQEVNCPGVFRTLLLTVRGSSNFFCDIASMISEISVELGWNRFDPAS